MFFSVQPPCRLPYGTGVVRFVACRATRREVVAPNHGASARPTLQPSVKSSACLSYQLGKNTVGHEAQVRDASRPNKDRLTTGGIPDSKHGNQSFVETLYARRHICHTQLCFSCSTSCAVRKERCTALRFLKHRVRRGVPKLTNGRVLKRRSTRSKFSCPSASAPLPRRQRAGINHHQTRARRDLWHGDAFINHHRAACLHRAARVRCRVTFKARQPRFRRQ